MSAQEPGNAKQQADAAFYPTLVAIVGSVAGTLITTALDKSPTVKLIGAGLGAAVPPLIAAAGRFSRLRLAGGVIVAVLALVLTYIGFSVPETALGMESTFPLPPGLRPTVDPPVTTPPVRPTTTDVRRGHCEGQLCILVEPMQVHCTADQCDSAVEVTSTGTTRLRIADIEFRGEIADRFSQTGNCANEVLIKNEQCSITVHVAPGLGGTAQMRIHQNFKGPASVVSLDADTWETTPTTNTPGLLPDFTLTAVPRCSVIPGSQFGGADRLILFVAVKNIGDGGFGGPVPFRVRGDSGHRGGGEKTFGTGSTGGSTLMQVDLRSSDYGLTHHFTVTVDPNNEIPEANDDNNLLRLRVPLTTRPKAVKDVPCTLI